MFHAIILYVTLLELILKNYFDVSSMFGFKNILSFMVTVLENRFIKL